MLTLLREIGMQLGIDAIVVYTFLFHCVLDAELLLLVPECAKEHLSYKLMSCRRWDLVSAEQSFTIGLLQLCNLTIIIV